MNAEQARERARDILGDCDHVYYRNDFKGISKSGVCADCFAAALLATYKEGRREMAKEAVKQLQALLDSPMLMGKNAWEAGRIAALASGIYAIRALKEE